MKARVVWPDPVWERLIELPEREMWEILTHTRLLARFPRMHPVKERGRFRRLRWFRVGNSLVFYRLVGHTVYIRAIWPARVP